MWTLIFKAVFQQLLESLKDSLSQFSKETNSSDA